jgi:hypothetical protein
LSYSAATPQHFTVFLSTCWHHSIQFSVAILFKFFCPSVQFYVVLLSIIILSFCQLCCPFVQYSLVLLDNILCPAVQFYIYVVLLSDIR